MTEQWRPVLGYEGVYDASDLGRVRRVVTRGGNPTEKINRPGMRRGYDNFTLSFEGVTRTFCAHRLIWEAFNGAIPEGLQINHRNGDKRDNRLANLEVCTPSENTLHAVRVLKRPWTVPPHKPGSANGRAKLSEDDVREIRRLRADEGWSQQKLADRFGVHQTGISALLRGVSWR